MTYANKLPKGVTLSPYLKEKADGYLRVLHGGSRYYIPLTRGMKKLFGIRRQKENLIYSGDTQNQFNDMVMIIIDAIYLQIRDGVGSEIGANLLQEIHQRIDHVLAPQIGKEFDKQFDKKLIGEGKKQT